MRLFPGGASDKESTCPCRTRKKHRFNLWVAKIPWRRKWQPTQVFLPGKSHGQWSLAGYSPWGHKSKIKQRLNHYHLTWLNFGREDFIYTYTYIYIYTHAHIYMSLYTIIYIIIIYMCVYIHIYIFKRL